jgi:hypothetical protein
MPLHPPTDRRGFALALALFALVVMGALVSGSFFAGRLEQQSGQNSMFATQALEAAEAGLSDLLANTNPVLLEPLVPGGPALDLGPLATGMRVTAAREVVRLTGSLFLLRSTGVRHDADGQPLATRSLGLLVRVTPGSAGAPARLIPVDERAWVQLS